MMHETRRCLSEAGRVFLKWLRYRGDGTHQPAVKPLVCRRMAVQVLFDSLCQPDRNRRNLHRRRYLERQHVFQLDEYVPPFFIRELSLAWQDRQRRSFSDGIQPSSEVFAWHIRPVCAASPNKSALLPVQPGLERYWIESNDNFGFIHHNSPDWKKPPADSDVSPIDVRPLLLIMVPPALEASGSRPQFPNSAGQWRCSWLQPDAHIPVPAPVR